MRKLIVAGLIETVLAMLLLLTAACASTKAYKQSPVEAVTWPLEGEFANTSVNNLMILYLEAPVDTPEQRARAERIYALYKKYVASHHQ